MISAAFPQKIIQNTRNNTSGLTPGKNAFRISPRNAPGVQLNLRSQFMDLSSFSSCINHSLLKLFTGFAIAAFIAWKLMVASAIIIEASPPTTNNHQLILMR